MFFGVATMFQFLLAASDLADRNLSAWRTGLFGAAPMPASAVEQLEATLPHFEFMQLCGQTEAGPGGIDSTGAQVEARPDASDRQPIMLTEVRIVDAWLHTGDLARLNPDGYMTLTHRIKDTITLPQAQEFCRERLSRYKVPHDLIIRPIPRNPSGRIMERVIRSEMADAD